MKTKSFLLVVCGLVLGACSGDGLVSPDVLTFAASARVVPNPYLRVSVPSVESTVTITNERGSPITFNYSHCPGVLISVYQTSDRSGPPVYSSSAVLECAAIGYGATTLAPGESLQLVSYESVAAVLGTDRPAGTYYLDAKVHVGGGVVRGADVSFSAGSIQLAR